MGMRFHRETGLTLIEVLILLSLSAILAGLGVSALSHLQRYVRLERACREFTSSLEEARRRAVGGNLPMEVAISLGANAYGLALPGEAPDGWRPLPTGVYFSSMPRRAVTFYTRGSAVPAGSYTLHLRDTSVRIVISAAGRVRWEWQ